jgi:hypothetical protein
MENPDVLGMSDEDFLQLNGPTEKQQEEDPKPDPVVEVTEPVKVETAEEVLEVDEEKIQEEEAVVAETLKDSQPDPVTKNEPVKVDEPASTINYEEQYNRLMAPFKANGKMITLNSPEELIQLAQMGANYTRKMQDIQPHRKVLQMLQNNGLLDEGKLSFLIDLDKKDPEAIKKLIKDTGMDPLDIDTSVEPAYKEGNHRISDEDVAFTTALEDIKSTPNGIETIQVINQWDHASKDLLWKSPDLMAVIHSQRDNGIYDRIATEIDRRKTLGIIPATVPFIQAYRVVGDELNNQGKFNDLVKPIPKNNQPIATRVVTPKPTVTNGTKASAASTTRSVTTSAKQLVNPLAMSDEDFLKQMNNRV